MVKRNKRVSKLGAVVFAGAMLYGTVSVPLGVSAGDVTVGESESISNKKKELEKMLEEKGKEIEVMQEGIDKEIEKIFGLGEEINKLEDSIKSIGLDIKKAEEEISILQDEIDSIEERIKEREDVIRDRLRTIQVNGGDTNYLDVLLGSRSFTDFIDRYTAVKTLMDADKQVMDEQIKDKEELDDKKEEMDKELEKLQDKKDEVEEGLKELNDKKEKQDKLIEELELQQEENITEKGKLEDEYVEVLVMESELEESIISSQMEMYLEESEYLFGRYCNDLEGIDREKFDKKINNSGVLAGKSDSIIDISNKHGLDPVLVSAIILHETGNGTSNAIKNYNNPGGLMSPSSNWSRLTKFSSLDEGLDAMGKTLHRIMVKEGKKSISQIGAVYAPIGADNDPTGLNRYWKTSVMKNIEILGGLTTKCEDSKSQLVLGQDGGNWLVPTKGRISSQFGWRMHPIEKVRKQHRGLDIANAVGTPIRSAEEGVVSEARWMGGFGNAIMITHVIEGKAMTTVYAHLSGMDVKKGDRVKRGQLIGKMGSTGNSTGPHLHFEVHEGYYSSSGPSAVNPLKYLTR